MTRAEILRLEPGPELDQLVAERVMGWHLPDDPELPKAWMKKDPESRTGEVWVGWWAEEPPVEKDPDTLEEYIPSAWLLAGHKIWSPSTDIAAAWEVVKKMLDSGWGCEIYSPNNPYALEDIDKWVVVFAKSELLDYRAKASSAPLAICRAALLAVMEVNHGDT